jgi:hypothetical protein
LSIDANTGLISGIVSAGAAGSYDPVKIRVKDYKGYSTQIEFVWTITVDLPPPDINLFLPLIRIDP